MFRTIFVVVMLAVGWGFALQSPLYAACLYLWIAYFRPESWAWSDIFLTLNLSYIAGAYLIFRTLISGIRWRFDLRMGLIVLFLAQALVSSWLGIHSAHSLAHWQEFAKVAVISILLTNIIRTESELRLILMVIALSLGFEAVKQGWLNLILHPGGRNDNPVPFLGDNNLVAVGMAMLLPVMMALGSTSTGWRKRAFQFMDVGVLYRAISTYSRGGVLSIGTVGAIYFWRSPHKLRAAAAVVVALLIVVPVLPPTFWARMSTIAASDDERDDSQQGRLHFWNVAVAMANDRPLLGVGHDGYELAYNQYDSSDGRFGSNRATHSAWLGILAESGYPGLTLFVAIVISSILACGRVRRAARRGEVSDALGAYAVAFETALIAFVVGGSFVSFQYCEMLWHFFALSVALERVAVAQTAESRVGREKEHRIAAAASASAPESDRDFAWT